MKFLVVALVALLSTPAYAAEVCADVNESLRSSKIVTNPNGSITIVDPLFTFRGDLYHVSAKNGASALCAMFGKKALKSKSELYEDARISDFDADGTFLGAGDYRSGKIVDVVVCN